ncbi:MAG: hypothetical protein KKC18_11995 [Chloroflexi bacterium]|nr:hypothetical protein [Chloroflexota bacterium]
MGAQVHPHTLVFSLYGQYVLPREEQVWIGSLIQALGAFGFTAGAVRTLVSRMQRKGLLRGQRMGRRSFYRLTEAGLKEVRWGSKQAFTPPDGEWDGRWTVITYSVPEAHRERRDALRGALKHWGFGALAPGAWISPHPLPPETEKKLQGLGAWEHLEILSAEHLGPSDSCALAAHSWPQLLALGERYRAYVAEYEPTLHLFEAGILDDKGCFTAQLRSLVDFVTVTLEDPALPPSLLPKDWSRPSAQLLFKELQRVLSEPAKRFFDAIYETQ